MITETAMQAARRLHALGTAIDTLHDALEYGAAAALQPFADVARADLRYAIDADVRANWSGAAMNYRTIQARDRAIEGEVGKRFALAMQLAARG